jgi:hypothetical protein
MALTITALPPAPNKLADTPAIFSSKADTFVAALTGFGTEANALAAEAEVNAATAESKATAAASSADAAAASALTATNAPGTSGTSSSSVAIGTGLKVLTIQAGKALVAGMRVLITRTSYPTTHYMYGVVTLYAPSTGDLMVTVEYAYGSGTYTSWSVSLTSLRTGSVIPPSGVEMTGGIVGMVLRNSTGDAQHDISISAGACMDSTGVYHISAASAMVKRINAAWAAGSASGGNLYGSVGGPGVYGVWALRKDADGTVDYGFLQADKSIDTYKPAGYTHYRWICSVFTDASANIRNFTHTNDDTIVFTNAYEILTNVNTSSLISQYISLSIPNINPGPITIGANDGSTTVAIGINATESLVKIQSVAGTTWADILGNASQNTIVTVPLTRTGAIYLNTNGVSVDIWLKAVKITR